MFKRIYKLVASIILWIRQWLNEIREKKPERFDKAVKIATFLIPFVSCFAPALVTNNWSRAILEFVVLTLILVFQWSTFTNRIVEKENSLQSVRAIVEKQAEEIQELHRDTDDYTAWIGEDENLHKADLAVLNRRFDDLAGFSHLVSDNVKKIMAEIERPVDARVVVKITKFFQESLTSLESILSEHYNQEIRSSIKITIDGNTVKTYARGRNNIISRGGEYHCVQLNEKEIGIEENYAYIAICWREQQFFAEGNLLELHNKFEPDDVFFCEYGDNYTDIFYSTIVMPIRIPVFDGIPPDQQEPSQEVLGLLCVDCKAEIPEWSDDNLRKKRAYHIIADYADSLAMLVKEYRDASRTQE